MKFLELCLSATSFEHGMLPTCRYSGGAWAREIGKRVEFNPPESDKGPVGGIKENKDNNAGCHDSKVDVVQ